MQSGLRIGLFLNTGEFPAMTHDQIYEQTLAEIDLAEALDYDAGKATDGGGCVGGDSRERP